MVLALLAVWVLALQLLELPLLALALQLLELLLAPLPLPVSQQLAQEPLLEPRL